MVFCMKKYFHFTKQFVTDVATDRERKHFYRMGLAVLSVLSFYYKRSYMPTLNLGALLASSIFCTSDHIFLTQPA